MIELSNFLGISIGFCDDLSSPVHVHVRYNDHGCAINLGNMAFINGNLPPRIAALATEWIMAHKDAINHNFELYRTGQQVRFIPPLVE